MAEVTEPYCEGQQRLYIATSSNGGQKSAHNSSEASLRFAPPKIRQGFIVFFIVPCQRGRCIRLVAVIAVAILSKPAANAIHQETPRRLWTSPWHSREATRQLHHNHRPATGQGGLNGHRDLLKVHKNNCTGWCSTYAAIQAGAGLHV